MLQVCRNQGTRCRYELVSGLGEQGRFVHVVNRITTTHRGRRYDYIIDASQHPGSVFPIGREASLAASQVEHLVDRFEFLGTSRRALLP
jgi:hypothetical protein